MSLTSLFKLSNVPVPKNIRQGWSSRSDGRVVLTLWFDRISPDGQHYDGSNGDNGEGGDAPGDQRREHIAYALKHLHGEVSSIIVWRKPGSTTDQIVESEIGPTWRIKGFKPKTGSFSLERITFANFRKLEQGPASAPGRGDGRQASLGRGYRRPERRSS
jgi:hypothetical protein